MLLHRAVNPIGGSVTMSLSIPTPTFSHQSNLSGRASQRLLGLPIVGIYAQQLTV